MSHLRAYFYCMNQRGMLFLESEKRRNMATALKDKPFLDFFYRMLRPNPRFKLSTTPLNALETDGSNFALVSPCGREINYVRPPDDHSVLGFTDLIKSNPNCELSVTAGQFSDDSVTNAELFLSYGSGTPKEPFSPNAVVFKPDSGRLYHRLSKHRHLGGQLGLLHPSLAESLATKIIFKGDTPFLRWADTEIPLSEG